jgi:hypothetical protein
LKRGQSDNVHRRENILQRTLPLILPRHCIAITCIVGYLPHANCRLGSSHDTRRETKSFVADPRTGGSNRVAVILRLRPFFAQTVVQRDNLESRLGERGVNRLINVRVGAFQLEASNSDALRGRLRSLAALYRATKPFCSRSIPCTV